MSKPKTTLFYAILIALVSTVVGMIIASRLDLTPTSSAQSLAMPPMNSSPLTGTLDAQTFRNIAQSQSPMVVNIRTESRRKTQELTDFFGGDDLLRRFFGEPGQAPEPQITEGAGTGFIIDASGLILTNNHVVEGATKVEVALFTEPGELPDDTRYNARVVGRDPLTDSALIQLTETPDQPLPVAIFGDSDQMMPGDWVMAIGNPFNLAHTVTVGVISAKGRPMNVAQGRFQQVLQTDAAINPGNSGGPLLNIRGEVVGINTAILSGGRTPANLGIGFAVPINMVRELLPQLREGRVTRGRMGVTISAVRSEAVEAFGLTDRRGAVVSTVLPDGPAAKAGVEPGDVIVEYNGQPVETTDDLVQRVIRTRPGDAVPVRIIRDRESMTIDVTIEELDLENEGQVDRQPTDTATSFGMTLQDLSANVARRLRMPPDSAGAVVTEVAPRSPASRGGVQPGDVILEVNRQAVAGAQDASTELDDVSSGEAAFLLVWRRGQEVFLTATRE